MPLYLATRNAPMEASTHGTIRNACKWSLAYTAALSGRLALSGWEVGGANDLL